MKSILLKIYYSILEAREKIIIQYNRRIVTKRKSPKVMNTDETLEKILKDKCSISRYGDGEFALMYGENLKFQPYCEQISDRLREIIKSNNKNHIVCLPNVFDCLDNYTQKSADYWNKYISLNYHKIYKMIDLKKQYYDTQVTRLYIDINNKSLVGRRFNKIKKLWEERDIVIVEGEKSRLGTGNDLFEKSKSIKRMVCPSIDAFSKYSDILSEVKKQSKDNLILIALGPTATILAYDLSKVGYQAIDIGHIDIEYEWFLQGATEKCPINNKYIGEINDGDIVGDIDDKEYRNQIISSIK